MSKDNNEVVTHCSAIDEDKDVFFTRTCEMTDEESCIYNKNANHDVLIGTKINNDRMNKHVRFVTFYLYRKVKV